MAGCRLTIEGKMGMMDFVPLDIAYFYRARSLIPLGRLLVIIHGDKGKKVKGVKGFAVQLPSRIWVPTRGPQHAFRCNHESLGDVGDCCDVASWSRSLE